MTQMLAALTFDDGPDERWTPQILDLLDEWGYKATFFVLGAHIAGNEEILRRMVTDGHVIGNHGWTHRHFSQLSLSDVWEEELYPTARAIRDATGIVVNLWRAPYLDAPAELVAAVGPPHIGCDVIVSDWAETDAQVIAQRVLDKLHDRGIVLLHDGVPPQGANGTQDRQPTVDAVAMLLPTPGVTWCSVGEL